MASDSIAGEQAGFSPLAFGEACAVPGQIDTRDWRPIAFGSADAGHAGASTPGELVAAAEAEGERILSSARQQARALKAEAEADRRAAREELQGLREFIARFEGELESARRGLLERIEPEVAGLIAQMAGKVVRRVIATDADVVVDVVRDTLRKVTDSNRIRVHIHPEDRRRIEDNGDDIRLALEPGATLEITEDEGVERGGCVVRTDEVEINADIAHQLAVLQDRFENVSEGARRSAA